MPLEDSFIIRLLLECKWNFPEGVFQLPLNYIARLMRLFYRTCERDRDCRPIRLCEDGV